MTSQSSSGHSLNNALSNTTLQIKHQGSAPFTVQASALPPGVLSNTQPGSVVMIPAHLMTQVSIKQMFKIFYESLLSSGKNFKFSGS